MLWIPVLYFQPIGTLAELEWPSGPGFYQIREILHDERNCGEKQARQFDNKPHLLSRHFDFMSSRAKATDLIPRISALKEDEIETVSEYVDLLMRARESKLL